MPFNSSITGGQAQLSVRRADGKIETISVKIPAGIEDGKKIRLRGQGEPSPSGGTPGDLLITVRVAEHPHFRRRGGDLELAVPVTLAEAALGAKIDVPTPQGEISLKIPPGTSSGKRLRLKGLGVPNAEGRPRGPVRRNPNRDSGLVGRGELGTRPPVRQAAVVAAAGRSPMVMLLGLLGCYGWALVQAEREDAHRPVPDGSAAIRLVGLPLQTQQPLLLRLKPQDRARVLAALAALVILGFALVLLAWWGARFTRRYLKRPWPQQRAASLRHRLRIRLGRQASVRRTLGRRRRP